MDNNYNPNQNRPWSHFPPPQPTMKSKYSYPQNNIQDSSQSFQDQYPQYAYQSAQFPPSSSSSSLSQAIPPSTSQHHNRSSSYSAYSLRSDEVFDSSRSVAPQNHSYQSHSSIYDAANDGHPQRTQSASSSPYLDYSPNSNESSMTAGMDPLMVPFVTSPPASSTTFPSQSTLPSESITQQSLQSHLLLNSSKFSSSSVKRPRIADEQQDVDFADQKEKPRLGACVRCKALKVRCEFKTDTDPCKRCLNGGHECMTPGRKKRRTPPKREHLLNQIREQAEQIKKLMATLENVQSSKPNPAPKHPDSASSQGVSRSPALSPASSHASYYGQDSTTDADPVSSIDDETKQVVDDWISKAKESLAEFGSFIGAGMPKSYILDQDPEDSPSSDGEDDVDKAANEYDIAVLDSDGEDVTCDRTVRRGSSHKLRRSHSASSGGSFSGNISRQKLATLPSEAVPFGLMAGLSLKTRRQMSLSEDDAVVPEGSVGVASGHFFRSSPTPELGLGTFQIPNQSPNILTRGIVTPDEVKDLFKIYFDNMNLSVSLVDPVLYTVEKTLYRSPFLFTVICAIASRHYTPRSELYDQIMGAAQTAAGPALVSGPKNVELVIAYMLLSLYPVPAKRWEDSRGWLFLGIAIRVAVDINLHIPATAKIVSENHAREQLNRTRVWLNCFNLDRSTGSQYGKAPIINNTDYIANNSSTWWKSSKCNLENFDIHICCYNAELRAMAAFRSNIYSDPNHPTGLNKDINMKNLAIKMDDQMHALEAQWLTKLEGTNMTDPQHCFRTGLLKLAFSYNRLICLSFGFQHAFGKDLKKDENTFFWRCMTAATDVLKTVVYEIGKDSQRVYLSHGPDAQQVFATFAAAFLLRLLQPKYATYVNAEMRSEGRCLIQNLIDLFEDVAIDERHGPMLYAKFLKGLLSAATQLEGPSPNRPKTARKQKSTSFSPSRTPFNLFSPQGYPDSGLPGDHQPVRFGSDLNSSPTLNSGPTIDMTDYFQAPLPFDDDILQSMQNVTDPSVWPDMALPGYDWLGQFSNAPGQRHNQTIVKMEGDSAMITWNAYNS